jgi:hypothetical protein
MVVAFDMGDGHLHAYKFDTRPWMKGGEPTAVPVPVLAKRGIGNRPGGLRPATRNE